jgi:hypothetical protein
MVGTRAGLRHVGSLGRLITWHPFKPIFFKYLFNIYHKYNINIVCVILVSIPPMPNVVAFKLP